MDPLTIFNTFTALSKIAVGASGALFKFVLETRHVDQSIQDLAGEVQSFNAVLQPIGVALTESSVLQPGQATRCADQKVDVQKLWWVVYDALADCHNTVSQISSIIDRLGKKKTDWAGLAIRQLRLNMRKDDIVSLRHKLQVNSAALHTILQLLSIRSLYKGNTAIDALGDRIEQLQTSVNLFVELKSKEYKSMPILSSSAQSQFAKSDRLSGLAVEYILEAKSVHSTSVAASPYAERAKTPAKQLELANWMQTVPVLSTHNLSEPDTPTTMFRSDSPSNETTSEEHMIFLYTSPHHSLGINFNREDDFHTARIQTLFNGVAEMFLLGAYEITFPALRVFKTNFKQLPEHKRDPTMARDLDMMAGIIEYQFGRMNRAASLFQKILRQNAVDEEDMLRKCQASHILSHICLLEANLRQGEIYCRNALREQRRILGKNHEDYLNSLWLLGGIYQAMNRRDEAIALQTQVASYGKASDRGNFPVRIDWQLTWNKSGKHEFVHVNPLNPGRCQLPEQSFSGSLSALSPCGNIGIYQVGNEVEIRSAKNGNHGTSSVELSSNLTSAAFSFDGRLIVVGSRGGTVGVYDTFTGALRVGYSEDGHISKVAFSQRGKRIAYGIHHSVKVRGSTTDSIYRSFDNLCGEATEIMFSSDGQTLAIGVKSTESLLQESKQEAGMYLYNLRNGQLIATIDSTALLGKISAMVFSEDTQLVASASGSNICIRNTLTGAPYGARLTDCGAVMNLALYVEYELLASRTAKSVTLWNFRTGAQLHRWSKIRDSTGAFFTRKVLIYPDNVESKPYQAHKKGQGISGSKFVTDRTPPPLS